MLIYHTAAARAHTHYVRIGGGGSLYTTKSSNATTYLGGVSLQDDVLSLLDVMGFMGVGVGTHCF